MPGLDDLKASAPTVTRTPAPIARGGLDALHAAPRGLDALKSTKPAKHGAASFLETVADVLDVPLASAEAGASDLWGMVNNQQHPITDVGYWATHYGPHSQQVLKDLSQGGAHQVAQNDVYFRKGSLDRIMADPNATPIQKARAQWFSKHPWAAGAADFITEFANPVNVITGEVGRGVGLAARAGVGALKQVPHLGPAIEAAGNFGASLVDKYHPLKLVSRAAGQIGWLTDASKRVASAANARLTQEVFGRAGMLRGTTTADRFEILRRATGGAPMSAEQLAAAYPQTLKAARLTLSDSELTARANLFRQTHDALDQEILARRMAQPDELMQNYFNMSGAYNPDVFDKSIARVGGAMAAGAGAAKRLGFRSLNTNEKVFRTFDEALAANEQSGGKLFKPGFDPANQFLQHLNKISGNIAFDTFVQRLTAEAPEAAHELTLGGLKGPDAVKAGLTVARRQATALAVRRAAAEVAKQYNLTAQQMSAIIAKRFSGESALRGKLSELQQGVKQLGRLGARTGAAATDIYRQSVNRATDRLGNLADVQFERQEAQQIPKARILKSTSEDAAAAAREQNAAREAALNPRKIASAKAQQTESARAANLIAPLPGRIGRISGEYQQRMLERGQMLASKLTAPERVIQKEYQALRDEFDAALQPKFKERALEQMTPQGYQRLKGVPGLSGLERLQYTALKPEIIKYLTEYGAPPREASALASAVDRFNALYRIGIVTNPIVHPFYNLLWAYLGSGGNPLRLVKMFRGAATALDHQAEKYGAHAVFDGTQTALGGSYGQVMAGSFADAGGIMGKTDWAISRLADANRRLVFDRFERNMATELWDDLRNKNLAKGMDAENAARTAGEQVRRAFGDYDNISSAERNMRYAFFFYPWTKAVIPFWLKAGVERPQMVNAPMRAIQTHNVLAGDPNADKEKMGTLYLGKDAQGQPVYKTVPLPQRYLEDIGETVIPRKGGEADISAGIPERMMGVAGIAQNHLVPAYGVAAATGAQLANPQAEEPGVTPASHVVFNRDAPLATQVGQAAQYIGTQALPFGGNISNLAGAFREALRGVPQAIPQALMGGFEYEQRTPLEQRSLNRFMAQFVRRYDHAAKLPAAKRTELQTAAYILFRRQVDALLNPKAPGTPTPPSMPPPATPQPQGGLDNMRP